MIEELIISTLLGFIIFVISLFSLLMLIPKWVIYRKAGKPGWSCLIPIFEFIILLEITDRSIWWFFLMFIPPMTLIIPIILTFDLARVFDKGIGFGFGLLFLPIIFIPILAFGDAEYTAEERF